MNEQYNYIERLLFLKKESLFTPWQITYLHPLDAQKKVTYYLADKYAKKETLYQSIPVIEAGTDFQYILNQLLLQAVDKYPYEWPFSGQKLDPQGYDFQTDYTEDGQAKVFEITQSAKVILWEKCQISPPEPVYETPLTKEKTVRGAMLSKFSLTLAKASPVSSLSFRLHTVKPMTLLSLVYESDIQNYHEAKELVLDYVSMTQNEDHLLLTFVKPVFAKRFTFVLSQDNALENRYYEGLVETDQRQKYEESVRGEIR